MLNFIEVKTALKWIMTPLICEKFGVKAATDDKFLINLQIRHREDDLTCFREFATLVEKMNEEQLE